MKLPEIELDDRRFQDLVSEARLRIIQSCPEWTEHNVSDPGITLIELFAWMTDMTIYRLNRVPDKVHVKLLELLGITLEPANAAKTRLLFSLAGPARDRVNFIGGRTEVGTIRTASDESLIFQVDEDFTIPSIRPSAYPVQRSGKITDVGVANGIAEPQGVDRLPFGTPPTVGDALYLGFSEPISSLILRVDVDGSQARGVGVEPEDPPLRWEVSQRDEEWEQATVHEDLTGGFNYGAGEIELQCPEKSAIHNIDEHRFYWLRCRIDETARVSGSDAAYTHPPEIFSITSAPIGALLPATHASREENETLGVSDGTPAQRFQFRNRPILKPIKGEVLEVLDPATDDWDIWEMKDDFSFSDDDDPHYVVNAAAGEIEFGPTIRQSDGTWQQYGAIPPKGATLRFSKYRFGGGRRGNVSVDTLTMLKSAIPGVSTVTNPESALGGEDPESLDSARQRASMEIRTRYRAVTTSDYEFLAAEASQRVARVVCVPPEKDTPIRVRIAPTVYPADTQIPLEKLVPPDDLLEDVTHYLDKRRILGSTLQVLPCRYRGVVVVADVTTMHLTDPERVENEVATALYTYLNPIIGGATSGVGEGWQFGRSLNQGELFGIIQAVDGVQFIRLLRVYEVDLADGKQSPTPAGSHILLEPDELIASGRHVIRASSLE